ncbi:MAG: hypothetical protein RLZZ200_2806 [Pseudomonadota bacterium]
MDTDFRRARTFCAGLAASVLVACGGGGSGAAVTGGGGTPAPARSTLNLSITDAPVIGATSVWISISGVEIKPTGGSAVSFPFSTPKGFDLLTLQNGNAATLLSDTTVDAGSYEWIRLTLDPAAGSSYVMDGSGQHALNIPSGAETGLKLVQGFTMPQGGRADFTIDFVLAKSLIAPPGRGPNYTFKPVLRLVDNVQVGTLSGTIETQTLAGIPSCATGTPKVYVYAGSVAPDDSYVPATGSADTATGPLTTATAELNASSLYAYKVAFLPAGTYTVALTCDADDPAVHDTVQTPASVTFLGYSSNPVTVSAKQTTTANF